MSAAEKLIEVEGLSKSYGDVLAVRGVTFGVGRGEVVGFLGPNGAGKSTTLRMLVGYLAPSAGRVRVAGHDMAEAPLLARRSIGYMPETAPVYPELRVGEHLELRAALKGLKRRERDAAVGDAAEKAGVAEVLGTLCGELSRGYRQRVALADALLGDPPLLVLDEPTAGLDPNQIRSVRELVASLGRDHTVLLSTHILSEVETICSRVLVIDRGLLVAEGSIAELAAERGAREAELVVSGDVARARTLIEEHPEVLRVADHAEPHASAKAESTAKLGDAAKPGAAVQPRDPAQLVRLSVRFRDAARPPPLDALIAILVGAGVSVHEARPATTRLEHLFQRLTGEAA